MLVYIYVNNKPELMVKDLQHLKSKKFYNIKVIKQVYIPLLISLVLKRE